jgi:cell division protein FtsB
MAKPRKKPDPIDARAHALNDEIAALEEQIKQLDSQLASAPPPPAPRLRSTALPHGSPNHPHSSATARHEPVFEKVDLERLSAQGEAVSPEHFNELGVRKYDLAAWFERIKSNFRGPPTANPRLVHYLAAGSVQGLRPMRYEKRVARNRFLAVTLLLLGLMIGFFAIVHRNQ